MIKILTLREVFCSFGMIVSDVRHDYMQALATNTDRFDIGAVNGVLKDLEDKAIQEMVEEGYPEGEVVLERFADAKYPAQIHELTIAVPNGAPLRDADIQKMAEAFIVFREVLE